MSASAWAGDLRRFSIRLWEDSETSVAAVALAHGEDGSGWLNLHHVKPEIGRIVFLWCCHAASRRAPIDVLYAHQLAALSDVYEEPADIERDPEPE